MRGENSRANFAKVAMDFFLAERSVLEALFMGNHPRQMLLLSRFFLCRGRRDVVRCFEVKQVKVESRGKINEMLRRGKYKCVK